MYHSFFAATSDNDVVSVVLMMMPHKVAFVKINDVNFWFAVGRMLVITDYTVALNDF